MKIKGLKNKLDLTGVSDDAYSLNGGLPSEKFCIGKNADKWEVYYSERGRKSGLKVFENEEEACDYFYEELVEMEKRMGLLKK